MRWIVLMDRVGGYLAYKALEEDAYDYDILTIALVGEAEAKRIAAMKGRNRGG